MASEPGFPVETADGEIVSVVKKEAQQQGANILVTADGRKFLMDDASGRAVEQKDEPKDDSKDDPKSSRGKSKAA